MVWQGCLRGSLLWKDRSDQLCFAYKVVGPVGSPPRLPWPWTHDTPSLSCPHRIPVPPRPGIHHPSGQRTSLGLEPDAVGLAIWSTVLRYGPTGVRHRTSWGLKLVVPQRSCYV